MSEHGYQKIFKLRKAVPEARKQESTVDSHERERLIMDALRPYSKDRKQTNLTEIKFEQTTEVTKNTSIVFVILPEWAYNFPPYNVARLAAVTKNAGYETHAFDLNAKARSDHHNWEGLDFNPWDGMRDWKWLGDHYHTELHRYVEPFLTEYVNKILEINPTVVGFCLYYCNEEPTKWMIAELKRLRPEIKIMVGGPQCHGSHWTPWSDIDYTITGEGEQLILTMLEQIEDGSAPPKAWLRQQEGQRLDLDSLPSPDYSYFPPEDYMMPNGVNMELSRGCTAKCVFCSETHFWKYRGRQARTVLDEVSDLYYNRGVDVIWFLDSLVNGNLKELRAFCKGVIASGIKIYWTGYARCDGRMDLEYFQDLADAGCLNLSYGIESGSNKVLADIDKGITVDEIEQNLRDGAITGVEGFSTWFVGFPTEEIQDLYESLMLIWRNRNTSLTNISVGHFQVPPDTIVAQNFKKYGVATSFFEGNWIHEQFTNSKIHRLIRLKIFNIVLNNLVNDRNVSFVNRQSVDDHYCLTFADPKLLKEIEYEKFDFNISKPGINPLADSVVNEVWPLLRLLWRSRGAYHIRLFFNPGIDFKEFGDWLCCDFTATIDFTIDEAGHWSTNCNYKFKQSDKAWHHVDFSRAESVAADRARKLAKGDYGDDLFNQGLLDAEARTAIDLSFDYAYTDTGKWD
jgi:hypothetical protein